MKMMRHFVPVMTAMSLFLKTQKLKVKKKIKKFLTGPISYISQS